MRVAGRRAAASWGDSASQDAAGADRRYTPRPGARDLRAAAAEALVDVRRLAVVRGYRDNFIDIARAASEEVADLYFPVLRRAAAQDDGEPVGGAAAPTT